MYYDPDDDGDGGGDGDMWGVVMGIGLICFIAGACYGGACAISWLQ